MRGGGGSETGSATIWVLSLATVVILVALLAAALGSVAVLRHRAAAAADLAALAAAAHALDGAAVACGAADRVAEAQGTRVDGCRLTGDIAEVSVQVRPSGRLSGWGVVRAVARAGPASSAVRGRSGGRLAPVVGVLVPENAAGR